MGVRFEVLTAASMKMDVFWVVAPCSMVEVNRRFRGTAASIIRTLTTEASTSETSVHFYHSTRRNNPEDSHIQAMEVSTGFSWLRIGPSGGFLKAR
jgi:hypothetical protein